MIDIAQKYSEELKKLFYDTWYDSRYNYFINGNYSDDFLLSNSNWDKFEFVSLNPKDNTIIGYVGYDIARANDKVSHLALINFKLDCTHSRNIFAIDLHRILKDMFLVYNFRKLCFSVVIGNPVAEKYERLVKKFGGRVVGVRKADIKLMDNNYYDVKFFEIFREDFVKHIKRQKGGN
jgi:hypothetical protein